MFAGWDVSSLLISFSLLMTVFIMTFLFTFLLFTSILFMYLLFFCSRIFCSRTFCSRLFCSRIFCSFLFSSLHLFLSLQIFFQSFSVRLASLVFSSVLFPLIVFFSGHFAGIMSDFIVLTFISQSFWYVSLSSSGPGIGALHCSRIPCVVRLHGVSSMSKVASMSGQIMNEIIQTENTTTLYKALKTFSLEYILISSEFHLVDKIMTSHYKRYRVAYWNGIIPELVTILQRGSATIRHMAMQFRKVYETPSLLCVYFRCLCKKLYISSVHYPPYKV